MSNGPTYTDRFGHTWSIRTQRSESGKPVLVFARRQIRLVAAEPASEPPAALTAGQLKELFCDAERVLVNDGETWYVGYRARTVARGRPSGQLYTQFRSETGEVRYSSAMLQFRHMSARQLWEQLAEARSAPGRRRSPSGSKG